MILVIDVGNTRVKAAVFEGNTLVEHFFFQKIELQESVQNIFQKYKNTTDVVMAAVSDINKEVLMGHNLAVKVHFLSHSDVFPFFNRYETPQTLGIDRMVLASGATLQYPKQNRLVIDAGTCVTYDFIDENDNYLGGAISPGMRIRYESLHHFTAKLPLLTSQNTEHFIGKSTTESIHSGVVNGLVFEIDGYINEIRGQYSKFIIILTGGDAVFLAKRLKNTIFANSNFLLESLNQTFQYKIKND